jgi:hypothetical protein
MTSEQIRGGQRRIALPAAECEVCRRLLDQDRNPATLVLTGIAGFPDKPLALINGKVLAQGEETTVTLGRRKVRIKCLEIRADSVSLQVDGSRVDLSIEQGKISVFRNLDPNHRFAPSQQALQNTANDRGGTINSVRDILIKRAR